MAPNELSDLSPLAENLNAKSNEVNETLALVNHKLAKLNIGIEVWLGPWEEHREPHQIGYAKVGDTWQLATRTCDAVEQENPRFDYNDWVAVPGSYEPPKPVLQASRDVRIYTLAMLPTIVDKLKEQIAENLNTIERAKKIAAEL
jgi:hypothetical protein